MNTKLQEIAANIEKHPSETSGHIYHPLPFPEFQHLKTSSNPKSAYHKWDLIQRAIPSFPVSTSLKMLDVGANAGFYTFNFAKLGVHVDAYEPHTHYVDIGQQIVEATGLPVQWYNKPLESPDLNGRSYDIALMLSVFQWISQGNKHLREATDLLKLIANSSHLLFFELGCNHGKSHISTNERSISWIWRLLQQNSAPKQVYFLGTTTAWGRAKRYLFACADHPIHLTRWQQTITHALNKRWIR